MRRASGTCRGSAVRMPGTSFQSTTRGAPQDASERGRGEVRAAAAERGQAAVRRRADVARSRPASRRARSSGPQRTRRALGRVAAKSGVRLPVAAVGDHELDRVHVLRHGGRLGEHRGQHRARGPLAARQHQVQRARAEVAAATTTARHRSRYSRAGGVDGQEQVVMRAARVHQLASRACGAGRGTAPRCAARPRRHRRADRRAPSSSRSVTPCSAEATTTSGPLLARHQRRRRGACRPRRRAKRRRTSRWRAPRALGAAPASRVGLRRPIRTKRSPRPPATGPSGARRGCGARRR